MLLYGLDACPVNVADKRSFDFMQTRLLMKWFDTESVDIVHECSVMFNIRSVSSLIVRRRQKFLTNFMDNPTLHCVSKNFHICLCLYLRQILTYFHLLLMHLVDNLQ